MAWLTKNKQSRKTFILHSAFLSEISSPTPFFYFPFLLPYINLINVFSKNSLYYTYILSRVQHLYYTLPSIVFLEKAVGKKN